MVPQCFVIMILSIKIPFSPIAIENFSIQCAYKSCRPFLCFSWNSCCVHLLSVCKDWYLYKISSGFLGAF